MTCFPESFPVLRRVSSPCKTVIRRFESDPRLEVVEKACSRGPFVFLGRGPIPVPRRSAWKCPLRVVGLQRENERVRNAMFIHLTSGASSANHVRAALKMLGRKERVVHSVDGLGVGPLHDIDDGAASRVRWWAKLEGKKPTARDARQLDESQLWSFLKEAKSPVVVWHSPFPTERLVALRLCWYLRKAPERVYEVKLPPGENPQLPAFYGAVGIVGPAKLAAAWAMHRRVRDVAGRAKRWAAIRSRRGDWIRHLAGDRVVHLPITGYDDKLVQACGDGWSSSTLVVARVLAYVPAGDTILRWRVRELLRLGRLEGKGPRSDLGLPNEVRVVPN